MIGVFERKEKLMGLLNMFSLRRKRPNLIPAYTAITRQARLPTHYGAGGVPDSFDGRFDMLALHVHLVLRRLRSDGIARDDIGQELFDIFFRDMDQAMRESGVGDLGVGKKIRKMAQAYYGRAAAYDDALGKTAPASKKTKPALVAVLVRNLYPDTAPDADNERLEALADEVYALEAKLQERGLDDILAGQVF